MYKGEYLPQSMYDRMRVRIREEAPSGTEAPRMTVNEQIFCEFLGEIDRKLNHLASRVEQLSRSRFQE